MGSRAYFSLLIRTMKAATSSAMAGMQAMGGIENLSQIISSQHELRTAANQFRQAARELDELDGMLTAAHHLKDD